MEIEVEYIGGDIVAEMVEENQRRYGNHNHRFIHLDLIQDKLPQVDLILCRDCLVHFSDRHIFSALKNIKNSGSTYILTTTFVGLERNQNIPLGLWRPINLQLPPFGFPIPKMLIDEGCPLEGYKDKHLGLWEIEDIPEY